MPFFIGRDERIRTSDFLHPMQALYQAELRPETPIVINHFYKIASNLIDNQQKFIIVVKKYEGKEDAQNKCDANIRTGRGAV